MKNGKGKDPRESKGRDDEEEDEDENLDDDKLQELLVNMQAEIDASAKSPVLDVAGTG